MEKKKSQKLPVKTINAKGKHPGGRPTSYNVALGVRICDVVATTTDGLNVLPDKHLWFPNKATVLEWRYKFPEFASRYAQAKLSQADLFAEEIIEIADTKYHNPEEVYQARLRIDTRKWIACKLLPRAYGDKTQNETTVTFSHEKALELLK